MNEDTLKAAIENNQFAHFLAFRSWPEVSVTEEDHLLYVHSKIPFRYFNAYMKLAAPYPDAEKYIADAVEYSLKEEVPIMWFTGPSTRPVEAEVILKKYHFIVEDISPGMAMDLSEIPKPKFSGFSIQQVLSEDDMADWRYVFENGFDMPDFAAKNFTQFYSALGFEPEARAHHFLAYVDDEIAGAATVFLGAGAAGIYNIATLKGFRGRGIGTALTLKALNYGLEKGFRVGVLQATKAGVPLYKKLGFREYCKVGIYNFNPS